MCDLIEFDLLKDILVLEIKHEFSRKLWTLFQSLYC